MEGSKDLIEQLNKLHLAEKSAVEIGKKEPDYVLDFAVQERDEDPLVASVCSNFSISLMLRSRLTVQGQLRGHTSTVTGVTFGKTNENLVYSCSKDKSVLCWDVRTSQKTTKLKNPPNVSSSFLALDISSSDNLLCASTEKDDDAFVLFWDMRKNAVLGCYNECHDDDITQVKFQPSSDKNLASGSADGLVCTFDLSENSEDDALQTTSNALSDVARIGWCGEDNNCVYCVTTDNMFYIWDGLEGDEYCAIDDLQKLFGESPCPVDYLVDCIPELTDKDSAVLVGGTQGGTVQLVSSSPRSPQVISSLTDGHSALVRCSHWDKRTNTLLTGGEDSLLCLWSADPNLSFGGKTPLSSNPKMKGKASVGDGGKPYSKGRRSK